jgi:HEAT repeat protein
MHAAPDPLAPVMGLLARYRSDVHTMRPATTAATLDAVEEHLGVLLPQGLRAFLVRHNGATLFRGALRVRAAADLASPETRAPEVTLFADGPRDDDHWGVAATADGYHFGRWDGTCLHPLHEAFPAWLHAQARILDEDRRDPAAQLAVRLEVDPDCGLLHLAQGERLLADGDADGAIRALRRAVALAPELAPAWQRLGETLLGTDRGEAQVAFLVALRATRLPVDYPGFPHAEPSLFRTLEALFPAGDAGWERELHRLLHERVTSLRHPEGVALYEAAALALARVHLTRDDRRAAREVLVALRDRTAGMAAVADLPELTLALVDLETALGLHDSAEDALRRLRRHPDDGVRARADLALGRIALLREEPWVDEILHEALAGPITTADRCDALLLSAEHAIARRADGGADARVPAALEEAARLAGLLGDDARKARASLLFGDVARARGDLPAACRNWLACDADPEASLRAEVRLGDLAADPGEALAHYARAVDGYRRLQLPIREAWARLRLVRCGDASQAEDARRIFREAGLAAGVAAADAVVDRPEANVAWHLTRAAELARQRQEAQRMRPPLVRADADRPERRLLAHRRAIARGDGRVVETLSDALRDELPRVEHAAGRPYDPGVMRFVAALDLLAGHPGWDAARVMMQLLVADIQNDTASRALMGALARSPNMTLVEALLAAVRSLTEPRALAAAAEALGWRREAEAAPRLRELAATGSSPVRRAAITALGRIGDEDAIDVILPALEVPELAEAASVALLLLGEWRGVDFHGQALAQDRTNLTRSPGELVGRHGGPSYLLLLLRVADREGPAGLGAIQGLGLLGSMRAVPKLIELCGHRDPARAASAQAALELLTGQRSDPEDPYPRQRWDIWWQTHGAAYDEGRRWRAGKPLDVRALVARLGDDDVGVRMSSYDELAISTGERLPFDADGPWRAQLAHRDAWTRWYDAHGHALSTRGWLFHGNEVG